MKENLKTSILNFKKCDEATEKIKQLKSKLDSPQKLNNSGNLLQAREKVVNSAKEFASSTQKLQTIAKKSPEELSDPVFEMSEHLETFLNDVCCALPFVDPNLQKDIISKFSSMLDESTDLIQSSKNLAQQKNNQNLQKLNSDFKKITHSLGFVVSSVKKKKNNFFHFNLS
jgi:ElaB/YqjD/DUF883 family membrane-anchored ribosome-binding protein